MANNWLGDKLVNRSNQTQFNLGALREARRYDPNTQEARLNALTSRLTSNASQRLAVAKGIGAATSGLIIGGVRDGARRRVGSGSSAINLGALDVNVIGTSSGGIAAGGSRIDNKGKKDKTGGKGGGSIIY